MSLTLPSLSTAISVYQLAMILFALLRCTQLPRDGHTSFTCNDQFAVTPTFRRRPRNAGNSDQTFPFPGTSGRARLGLTRPSRVAERDRERSTGERLNGVSVETGKR